MNQMTRRTFIGSATAACATAWLHAEEKPAAKPEPSTGLDFPLMDFHVHLDKSTIDAVLALPQARGVKFGIVEHAGTKENKYPTVLSNDEELGRYLDMLAGKSVLCGVQAEWVDWTSGFSTAALAKLDYVLTDTMTLPDKDGRRTKLWEKDVESLVEMADKQAFMDRFVDWHVKIISEQPIDILANTSWLPAPLAADYDAFWTPARVQKVVDAAVKHRVALEISSSYKLPRLPFLKIAKAAGVKFSFGSNGRYPKMGLLDYSIATAKELGLKRSDMFMPAPDGQKAVQRWKRP
jgi:histidinol phosphatase-like PHP family hydrolase